MKKIDKVGWSFVEMLAYRNTSKQNPLIISKVFRGTEGKVADVVAQVAGVTRAQTRGEWLE